MKKEKKIIYINLDGFSYSYYQYLHKHKLDKGFLELANDGIFFRNLYSGLISITNPMQSAILCGAWSNKTHNFYQHFDKETRKVLKHFRTFDAENIAQLFLKNGKTVVSIHQFMLENNPCVRGEKNNNYITSPKEHSNYKDRFELLGKIIKKEPIVIDEKEIVYEEFPDFLALYIDDLDSLGHNNNYEQFYKKKTYGERIFDIISRLNDIQNELVRMKELCISEGIYNDLIILLTTDHGMTPFFGKSHLNELRDDLNSLGIKAEVATCVKDDTEVVLLPYTIECSLYYIKDLDKEKKRKIDNLLKSKHYILKYLYKDEMMQKYGLDDRGPDVLISPIYNEHFYTKDYLENYGGNHDSLHKTSQHIFGMIFGGDIKKEVFTKRYRSIDLLPSIIRSNNNYFLKDSTSNNLFDVLSRKA